METKFVIAALAALAQESRLEIFRLLVQAGAEGVAAGRIAERLGLPAATLSFHLGQLKHAGLVTVRREGRSLIYAARYDAMNRLLAYLTKNCCGGSAASCGLSLDALECSQPRRSGMTVTIYHNPQCGTSRNVLAMIRNSGEEPEIIEYLETPPTRETLVELIRRMDIPPRDLLRRKGSPYDELGLDDSRFSDDELIDLMIAQPILINRPIVVTPLGVKLCRPSETVLDLLPNPQQGALSKEDGAPIIDAAGRRLDEGSGSR